MDSTLTLFAKKYFSVQGLTQSFLTFGLRALGAMIVLVIGYFVIHLAISILRTTLKRVVADATVRHYTVRTTRVTLWLILALILLGVFGIETASLVTILGAAGLAIGLAVQGSLGNFAAGLMLLMLRPFKSGDHVEVGAGITGTVVEIGLFSTELDTPDSIRAFVPNNLVFNSTIKNWTVNGYLRLELRIPIPAGADVSRSQQIVHRLLAAEDLVLETPPPEVQVVENATGGVMLLVRPYVKFINAESVRTAVNKQIREEFRASGIDPLPAPVAV